MSDKVVHPAIARLKAKFGTQTAIARAAGVKPHTICGKQGNANPLTYEQMRRILAAAPEMGVELSPADFFPDLCGQDAA